MILSQRLKKWVITRLFESYYLVKVLLKIWIFRSLHPQFFSWKTIKDLMDHFAFQKYLFDIFPRRHNFSLVAHYSLKKWLITRSKICSLLATEDAHCKKSLVNRCKVRLIIVAEIAHCKKSLVTRCKIRSLLVAECVRCKKITRYYLQNLFHYSLQKLLVAKICCL